MSWQTCHLFSEQVASYTALFTWNIVMKISQSCYMLIFFHLCRDVPGAVFTCTVFIAFRNNLEWLLLWKLNKRLYFSTDPGPYSAIPVVWIYLADGVYKLCLSLSGLKSNVSLFLQVCQSLLKLPAYFNRKNFGFFLNHPSRSPSVVKKFILHLALVEGNSNISQEVFWVFFFYFIRSILDTGIIRVNLLSSGDASEMKLLFHWYLSIGLFSTPKTFTWLVDSSTMTPTKAMRSICKALYILSPIIQEKLFKKNFSAIIAVI